MEIAEALLKLGGEAVSLALEVVRAVKRGEGERVEKILPAKLLVDTAKQLADAKAALKFDR